MRPILPLLTLGFCFGCYLGRPTPPAQAQPPEPQPDPILRPRPAPRQRPPRVGEPMAQITEDMTAFVTTLNRRQDVGFMTMQQFISGVRPGYFGANEWFPKMLETLPAKLVVDKMTVGNIQGKSASVSLTYHWEEKAQAPEGMNREFEKPRTETLALQHQTLIDRADIWQIVPPATEAEADERGQAGGYIAYFAFFLAQKNTPAPGSKLGALSMSNLKQLSLGVMQLTQDYDERYAFAPEYLQEAVFPYVRSKEIFLIPNLGIPYSFNGNLSDKNLAAMQQPANTVLFYEGEDEQPVFRYGGKAAIAFADGHVKLVTPDEMKTVSWVP